MSRSVNLSYLFKSFFQIGLYSFGGYTALISLVQRKLVKEDRILEERIIIDGLSIASILPGPLAVNMVTFIGFTLRGWAGAIISMIAVLLPSCLFMIVLAELNTRYGSMSMASSFLSGVVSVIVAIIFSVSLEMGKKHLTSVWQYLFTIGVLVISFFYNGYFTILILLSFGAVSGIILSPKAKSDLSNKITNDESKSKLLIGLLVVFVFFGSCFFIFTDEYRNILLVFSKISLTLFGGGYVMIPSLFDLVVDQQQWLTSAEFSRAIAFGQMTPGPILVSATYVGYQVGGIVGALLATMGIFLPSAVLMITVGFGFLQIKDRPIVLKIMNGIRAVVVGLIGYSVFILIDSAEFRLTTIIFAVTAYFLLTFAKFNFLIVILLSGLIGLLFF